MRGVLSLNNRTAGQKPQSPEKGKLLDLRRTRTSNLSYFRTPETEFLGRISNGWPSARLFQQALDAFKGPKQLVDGLRTVNGVVAVSPRIGESV